DGAFLAKVVDHVAIVNDFMAHIDGGAEQFERTFDNIDCAVHTGTEAARLGQQDLGAALRGKTFRHQRTPNNETSTRRSMPASGWLKSKRARSSSSSFNTPE